MTDERNGRCYQNNRPNNGNHKALLVKYQVESYYKID